MDLKVRKCKKSDHDFVYKVTKDTFKPIVSTYFDWSKSFFDEEFNKDYKKMKIVSKGKRRVGFYQLEGKKDYLYVTKIFLSPTYHGKGIGRHLMEYFETLGHKKIRLEVWKINPAVKFYKKLGYKVVKETGKKKHKYEMEKKL